MSYKVYFVFLMCEWFGELLLVFYFMLCIVLEIKDMVKKKVFVDDVGFWWVFGVKFVGFGCFFINE